MNAKFSLGRIVATPGSLRALEKAGQAPLHFLQLHAAGSWGDLDRDDSEANEKAIAHEDDPSRQGRVFSSYCTRTGTKLWIITESDRSCTTLLTPDEY